MKKNTSVFNEQINIDAAIVVDEVAVEKVSKKREKSQRALFTRRAVEDLLERKRLMRENNYIYEEDVDLIELD